ncbi:alpha/beta hydrolase [Rhodococcus globerulus]|uniref:Lysophospholipase n=1 Tax=Rhodococcus globerulus TaxID=33008 RepID=A0ABU4C3W9_RHOGO|nr:lysophospholipase [Rhodococcus globerulus]MDV6271199.1 lysophospholipase [Rhodococcus globerulus]
MTVVRSVAGSAVWDGPPHVAPRGTLIVVPGRGEHPGLYRRFGERLSADAYQVRVLSDPTVDQCVTLAQLTALTSAEDAEPLPTVLVGSDSGALFAAGVVADGVVAVDGLVLAGLPVVNAPAAPAPELEIEDRTACPTHQRVLTRDEHFRPGALARALPQAWFESADLSRIAVPTLALHGDADSISPLSSARAQYLAVLSIRLFSIVGGRHDVLNDQTHRTVAATIVLFLERLRLGQNLPTIAQDERNLR